MRSGDVGTQKRTDKLQLCDCEKTSRSGRIPRACACAGGRKTKIVTTSDRRHGHVMVSPFDSFMGTVVRPRGRVQTDSNFAVLRRLFS